MSHPHTDHHSHSHGHDHNHGRGHNHGHSHHAPNNRKGLTIALVMTSTIMLLEFFGGLLTNSLALLADSGHMLSDAAAIALSLTAIWLAAKPANARKSYGYHRFEILAALINGVSLFIIAGFIVAEAYERFFDPPQVASGGMMLIALIGLLANIASAAALMKQADIKNNINVRSAFLHIIGDALGSVGAIIAGLLMWLFSWYVADPIISVLVALLILRSAWAVMSKAIHVLMEGVPAHVDTNEVKRALSGIPDVTDVHDLHIWTITSGIDALSCHILIRESADNARILQQAVDIIEQQFNIAHATIQIETSALRHSDLNI